MNGRERILAMMDGKQVDRVPLMPITMMFACDQIGAKYKQYVTDFRVMAEAQLRTAERFDLDQVSCISDPTREATDLGAAVQFFDDQPPAMVESQALLADKSVLSRLKIPDPLGGGRMHDRVKAAALLKEKVAGERIVEGWIEGPCGQAANLRGINTLMLDFYDDPQFVRDLLAFVVEMELEFARAQRDAGAELAAGSSPSLSFPISWRWSTGSRRWVCARVPTSAAAQVISQIFVPCWDTTSWMWTPWCRSPLRALRWAPSKSSSGTWRLSMLCSVETAAT
jgi:hypothetical protein